MSNQHKKTGPGTVTGKTGVTFHVTTGGSTFNSGEDFGTGQATEISLHLKPAVFYKEKSGRI